MEPEKDSDGCCGVRTGGGCGRFPGPGVRDKFPENVIPQVDKAEDATEEKQWQEKIEAAGGISEEEAIEIAAKQMETEIGARAEGKEILRYEDGSAAVIKIDISERTDYEHKGDVAYMVHFYNPEDHSLYECTIDAVDGSILHINTNEPVEE